jgi:hypothetical protein
MLASNYYRVLAALRGQDAYLLQQHGREGRDEFYLVPGGVRLEADVAHEIISRPDVRPSNAGLIESGPQTWKLVRKENQSE